MNCEQVEELLSAYLDNALAFEEWREVGAHLQTCASCSAILVEYRRNDTLIERIPRVSPDPSLRNRIFTSPEFLELTGTFDNPGEAQKDWTVPKLPASSTRRDTPGRPQLIAIPGGRSTAPTPSVQIPPHRRNRNSNALRTLFVAIAATIILAISIGTMLGIYSWRLQNQVTNNGAITPPIGPLQSGPLSAGMRFVFLRDGALWSELANSSSKEADRLTPPGQTVAANWVVNPAQPGRSAGDMLAYIDLQKASVHVIRSDGQQDTTIKQPLLNSAVPPASVWDTDTGATILNSLAWSSDGSMLAFVAAPDKSDQTQLYIYSTETGITRVVPLSMKGSVSHPVWSPDGVRVAFELVNNGSESIVDYNTQNQGILTITGNVARVGDTVLSLDWSPSVDEPEITWSEGVIGHVHSLWVHRVGIGGSATPIQLLSGDYVQALYSRNGNNHTGSWLLVSNVDGQAGDLWRIDSIVGAGLVRLTTAKQVNFAQWSTDGTRVDYLDALSAGVGNFHVVDTRTGIDSLLATGVANYPVPAWSLDGQELVYSTGNRTGIVNLQAGNNISFLKLYGVASSFAWSVTSPHQVVVAQHDTAQGIYIVDTMHNTVQQMDALGASGPIEWTEIP
ncbi:MAG TPA: zf-HC2 domain-containing protein [Ktedonobacteraceae bacterium]|nr:zf-HC2 domain-containing protein [Ktedonobacteraceae bacterium]